MARKSMADLVRGDIQEPVEETRKETIGHSRVDQTDSEGSATRAGQAPADAVVEDRQGTTLDPLSVESLDTPDAASGTSGNVAKGETDPGEVTGTQSSGDYDNGDPDNGGPEELAVSMPKYLRMQRVDGRIREDQSWQLGRIAKSMNRRKKGGERITPNTLTRVAIDWIIMNEENLAGSTEEEIRERLGVEVR